MMPGCKGRVMARTPVIRDMMCWETVLGKEFKKKGGK